MSVIWETQKAVYEKLTGDTALMAMISGVYDHVPERSEFPYVTMGDIRANDNSVKATQGYQLDLNINVYSRGKGRKEILEIMSKVQELLVNENLAVVGGNHINTRFLSQGTALAKDGVTYQGKLFLRFVVY